MPSWPLCTGSPVLRYQCWSFSARNVRGSDLTVVAEAIDDGDVEQWLVPVVFTRARHSNVALARRHDSRAHMYMKTHPCKQGFEKKSAAQTDAEKLGELWRQH